MAMRAAAADVVPFKFVPYGEALRDYVDDLRRRFERNARAAEPGTAGGLTSFVELPTLVKAIRGFQDEAAALDRATDELARRDSVPRDKRAKVNDALTRIERALLLADGVAGRPWFKHAIYAPGLTTGYASWPMPGLRQAIEEKDAPGFAHATAVLTGRIDAATAAIRAAVEVVLK
jgi:N-acetylated-alpha-linked acidic dipeptidase